MAGDPSGARRTSSQRGWVDITTLLDEKLLYDTAVVMCKVFYSMLTLQVIRSLWSLRVYEDSPLCFAFFKG